MDQNVKFKYQGICQLLACSPWINSSRNLPQKPHEPMQEDSSAPKTPKLGFVPYMSSCSTKQNPQIDRDDDSDSDDDNSDSQLNDSKGKQDGNSDKKKESDQIRSRKGPYKKYTTEQKRQAIQLITAGKDIKTISKQFNIPRRNLLRWRKNGCERKEGGGRPSDFVMEQKLFDMILRGQVTTQKQIRQYALTMTNFKKFKASKGWYVKFWRRFHEYTARTGKSQGQVKLEIKAEIFPES